LYEAAKAKAKETKTTVLEVFVQNLFRKWDCLCEEPRISEWNEGRHYDQTCGLCPEKPDKLSLECGAC